MCQHLSFVFLVTPILIGVRESLKVVLVYVSCMTNDVEYFLNYLLAIYSSSFENSLFMSLLVLVIVFLTVF